MQDAPVYKHDKQKVYSSSDVRNLSDRHGCFYFSENTMRSFNSRLLQGFWPINDDWTEGMVVVSNKQPTGSIPREYHVVLMVQGHKEDGRTYVDFHTVRTFLSARGAREWASKNADMVGEAAQLENWGDVQDALDNL